MYTSHIGINWQHSLTPFYKDSLEKDLKRVHSLFARARESNVRVVPTTLKMNDIRRFLMSNRFAIIILVNLNSLSCHLCKEKSRKMWWRNLCFRKSPSPIEPVSVVSHSAAIDIQTLIVDTEQPTPISSVGSSVPRRLSFFPSSPNPSIASNSSLGQFTPPMKNGTITSATPLIPKLQRTSTDSKVGSSCVGICTSFSKRGYELVTSTDFEGHYIVLIGYDRENDMFFFRDPGTDSELCAASGDNLEAAFCCKETDHDMIVVKMM